MPTGDPIQSLIKRDIQDHVLNIDSDYIDVIHKVSEVTNEYEIVSTLIEIDMQSICSLLANFREILSSGGRNLSSKDIHVILDTMINDVRRLSSRSPTLFRLATRSTITKSDDTRYGFDYGNVFATITTSEGIRIFVERSVSCYLSLDDNTTDEEIVRPKFLQMLVMLLALLNDHDLQIIGSLFEDTFKIPGDREGLELLILKVLPLTSINSKVFMEDLLVACNYNLVGVSLREPKQQMEQWNKLQEDLAEKGYILPVLTRQAGDDDFHEDDLEAFLKQQELEDHDPVGIPRTSTGMSAGFSSNDLVSQYPRSWLAPWPQEKGLRDTTIFRHIQHCGKLRKEGNFQQETVKAVNKIPYLDMTSEDKENEYLAVFANGARFRVRSEDPDNISAMKRNKYTLRDTENNMIVDLDIETEVLNGPFVEATKQHNYLVDKINHFIGGRKERRKTIFSNKSAFTTFTCLEEPTEAMRVWAELVPPSGQRQLCAEAFKLGDRIVFREDILRNMGDTLSRLNANVLRIEKAIPTYRAKISDEETNRMQESSIKKLLENLDVIKTLQGDATRKRADLRQQSDVPLPSDPISEVIYTNFIGTSGEKPEWQTYTSQLTAARDRLIIKSKILKVDKAVMGDVTKLEFHSSKLCLTVQSLTSSSPINEDDIPPPIKEENLVLLLGYYVVHVEPHMTLKNGYLVHAYYRVLSQKRGEAVSRGNLPAAEKPQVFYLV